MRSWHGCWNTDPETSFSELRRRLFVTSGARDQRHGRQEFAECLWELGRDLREGMSEREREGAKDEETPDSQTGQTVNQSWMEFGSQKWMLLSTCIRKQRPDQTCASAIQFSARGQ